MPCESTDRAAARCFERIACPLAERPAGVLPAAVRGDAHRLPGVEWPAGRRGPVDAGTGEVVAIVDLIGEGVEVSFGLISVPAGRLHEPSVEGGIEWAAFGCGEGRRMPRMQREQRHGGPAAGVGGEIAVVRSRCREDVGETGALAGGSQRPDLLDAAELLDVGSPQWQRRRYEAAFRAVGIVVVEAVRGEAFGDALRVPRRRLERTERERECMHALVQQQMTAVGRIRLVGHPESVVVAMAVGKVGDLLRQQAGRTEPLAIDDEAAERPPLSMRRGIEGVVLAPCRPRLVEDAGQILDAVTGAGWSIGDEHEVVALQHPQPRPSCRRGEGIDRGCIDRIGSAAPLAGQAGSNDQHDDERPETHGRRV